MAKHNTWRKLDGIVFSTDPDFNLTANNEDEQPIEETPLPKLQKLRLRIERAGRKGKTVTIVSGFVGSEDNLKDLAKLLKTKLGIGGSAKDGEIVIQGDVREKAKDILIGLGYSNTK